MIKAIIFDLGGVLFTNGTKQFAQWVNQEYGIEVERLRQILDEGLGTEYREGKISRDEFWKRALEELEIEANIDELEDRWIQGYKLIEGTKEIVLALAKQYKVYFLSDNVKERVEKINSLYNFLEWFEGGVFSHEVGVRKPDPKIYQTTLEKACVRPEDSVFIDDKEINLPPARELGIHTILFTSPEECVEDLRKLGVNIHI